MITVGGRIYRIVGNELLSLDFLFGMKKIIKIEPDCKFMHYSDKYIVIGNQHHVAVIYRNMMIKKINYSQDPNHMKTICIVGDKLIMRREYNGINAPITIINLTDLSCNVQIVKAPFSQILPLPNGKIILAQGLLSNRIAFVWYNTRYIRICSSLKECWELLNYNTRENYFDYCLLFVNSDRIINIKRPKQNYFVQKISIDVFNFDLNLLYSVLFEEDNLHKLVESTCGIGFVADLIYIWNKKYVFVISQSVDVCIDNSYGIEVYNSRYNVFVNNKFQLFRIVNGKLVRYVHQYDLWNDSEYIPDVLVIVLDVLVDLELFPNEICNIIYCQSIYVRLVR